MTTTTNANTSFQIGLKQPALVIVGAIALYFAYQYAFHYFRWNEASYGYYWTYRIPLIFHLGGGLVALLVGVFQLWSGGTAKAMGAHPVSGRIYVGAVLVGSLGGMVLSVASALYGFAWAVGVFALAVAWLAATSMAFICIKRRNIKAHRQWMTRSYIITFAFVIFRFATDYVPYEAWWGISPQDMAVAMIWPVWVAPLLAYDLYLQHRER